MPRPPDLPRQTLLTLTVVVLLFAAACGMRGIAADSLWYDELWAYRHAGALDGPYSLVHIFSESAKEPFWPPGYLMLLSSWATFAGWSGVSSRMLSVFVGMLAIACMVTLGRELHSRRLGLYAAVILAGSGAVLYYLQEVRSYAPMILLTAVLLWSYLRLLRVGLRPAESAAFVLATSGVVYQHYFGALIPIALGIIHLLMLVSERAARALLPMLPTLSRARKLGILGLMVAALLVFAPWFALALSHLGGAIAWQRDVTGSFVLTPADILHQFLRSFSGENIALAALLAALALMGRQRGLAFAVLMTVLALTLALVINLVFPLIVTVRYLIVIVVPIALMLAYGVDALRARRAAPALALAIWLGGGAFASLNPDFRIFMAGGDFWNLPWTQYAQQLERGSPVTSDVALMFLPEYIMAWNHQPAADYYLLPVGVRPAVIESLPPFRERDYVKQIQDQLGDAQRAWVGYDPGQAPQRLRIIDETLAETYVPCAVLEDSAEFHLALYARRPDALPVLWFGRAAGVTMLTDLPLRASAMLDLMFGWSVPDSTTPYTYSFSVQLDDASGRLAAQSDQGLPGAGYACTPVTVATDAVSPGTYDVYLAVYAWETGERIPGGTPTDNPAERVHLGSVEISNGPRP